MYILTANPSIERIKEQVHYSQPRKTDSYLKEFQMKRISTALLLLFILSPVLSQEKINKFTTEDYLSMSSLSSPRMSPDGTLIVYTLGEKEKWDSRANHNLWLISTDGTKISFTGNTVGFSSNNSLFVYDLKTKELKNLTEKFDPTIRSVQWLDNRTITFLTLRRSYTGVFRVTLEGNDIQALLEPHFVTFAYSINHATNTLCFYGTRGQNPSKLNIYHCGGAATDAKPIYCPNEWITDKDLASTKVIRYPSYDGYTIEAVLTLPPYYDKTKKYPLLVLPHGGPDGMSLDDFGFLGQAFAQEDILVFEPNFRGGIGFGSEMYTANRGRLGDIDYKDIMAGVDHLIEEGVADPEKLIVGGWSYGGYMTNWIIGHTNRFKAAVSVAGIANTVSMYAQSDINHGELARWEFRGVPVLNMENFRRSSPIEFLYNCTTPTLILHGEADDRVPVVQAWETYRALTDLGVEVQMALYPDAGHGISAPKQFADVISRLLRWYKKFIQ